ncbi:hypothetical protein QA634_00935 [Methylobacterium sp. CB376]|uniref:hypothetical protein n=1 Tax=unclassified Methylobacterium TaxID=2615210 RepID=UPI0005B8AC64|nr:MULTISPECIES: hypothetical protein [Methylobacterium]WFT80513.1 hypothetical protein QA634_00935 [Methylobacterium nodulans]
MTLPSSLSRLMAVVIVMIAAVFGASAAQAHEGHAHHAASAVAHHSASPAPVAVPAQAVQAAAVTVSQVVTAIQADEQLRAASARLSPADDDKPCHGTCCAIGASCCVPGAMLPAATGVLPMLAPAARLTTAAEPFLAGIAREALPKPPRSLA